MREKEFCHYCGGGLTKKEMDGSVRLYCAHCREAIYENPVPATCLVVIDHLERVLLVKRSVEPKLGYWCLPGGFLELGESPEQGALRELEEETGLTGAIDRLLGVVTSQSAQYDTVLMVGFLVKNYRGNPVAGDDASDAAFFARGRLPEIAFESHEIFIQRYYE